MTSPSPPVVVVEADACVPRSLCDGLPMLVAPGDAPLLLERVSIPRLALERVPVDAAPAVHACASVADGGTSVLFVGVGDGYGGAADAVDRAGAAVRERGAAFAACGTGHALMAAGWPAVLAAEAARRGAGLAAAADVAAQAAAQAQLLAYLEHPELVGLSAAASPSLRAISGIRGASFDVFAMPPRRDIALALLRDRFAELVTSGPGEGLLRVAVHHAGTPAAAEAMARWTERNTDAAQVMVAPLTRHAAARLGPGMVAIAWVRDPVFA